MKRLTFVGNFCDIAQCRENPCPYNGSCSQREVWERLKAYEDSGVSPKACAQALEMENLLADEYYSMNRMLELLKADKEGRVVVLPCKVQDMAYGGYVSDVKSKDLAEAKEILAKQVAQWAKFIVLDKDMFTVDGEKVGWKLWIFDEKTIRRAENG